ncbi:MULTISPECIES: 2-hydroxychromene-2-carboxylate isomerase [Variovorax]|jgi:2-hydroxychromene-2-carboxylate isomerase|uniref:2-hydroxychromene-2-carboxylate isomerase n=1 Tax=Variovorax TaxID=34072 RepID=UPI00086C6310|nr:MULTISPECIES: 2-hydroxychromene-2-carboxylate isomerase [Variovorax]MBN8757662.1 2-hydroxychromene-2-carboxylate isomerase [Variovorax sp.]ODU14238.1 MAG: disulfide bond formation protein DsbA [Variovorax sp. SCN 67-85]ODV25609.1 MAG: disulfide bond formation protein DsbA [Variovorax sp. SCN 67-20]OJZ08751.1 MAG: disulfide bond formation protein DsbA [Variovorax sp. 67-131]UKI11138.1 2-hydroxychromene-2-carboxylate isomerase [Variovorax paradoxus]
MNALDVWFDFGSNYSYLSVMRVEQEAAAHGIGIRWQPFLLGPIFRSFGWETSPFVLQKEKGDYTWKDMARQCRKYGLPWQQPTRFPRPAVLPLRIALAGATQPWMGEFCRRTMTMNFAEDRDIDSPEAMRDLLAALGLPAHRILEEALSDANKLRLRRQTETAAEKGIFGAPTFFAGNEMFWGNDRLDEAIAHCKAMPSVP